MLDISNTVTLQQLFNPIWACRTAQRLKCMEQRQKLSVKRNVAKTCHIKWYTYSAFRSVGSIRFSFDIWHHPFKFQAICTNSFPTRLTMIVRKPLTPTKPARDPKLFLQEKKSSTRLFSPFKSPSHVFKNATLLEVAPALRKKEKLIRLRSAPEGRRLILSTGVPAKAWQGAQNMPKSPQFAVIVIHHCQVQHAHTQMTNSSSQRNNMFASTLWLESTHSWPNGLEEVCTKAWRRTGFCVRVSSI